MRCCDRPWFILTSPLILTFQCFPFPFAADTKPFQFQGCFKDDANQREMTVHKTFTDLSPQKCIDYCYTLGYKVAATRVGLPSLGQMSKFNFCGPSCRFHVSRKLGETPKFNFCGPRFPYSLTKSNYIVCDFCRSFTEQSGLSI